LPADREERDRTMRNPADNLLGKKVTTEVTAGARNNLQEKVQPRPPVGSRKTWLRGQVVESPCSMTIAASLSRS
jgi:hypothetical protein